MTDTDHGTTGQAMLHRPSEVRRIRGEYTGSATPGRAIEARCYMDTTLHDRMLISGAISHSQHEAADRLATLWHAAGLSPRVCGRYGEARGAALDDSDHTALDDFHAALRLLSKSEQWAAMDMLWGSALPVFRVPTLRDALDVLVREWGCD